MKERGRGRRGGAEGGHENSERWLLTYADLITLLLVFFVVMYSISKADERKWAKLSASMQRAFNVGVLTGEDASAVQGEGAESSIVPMAEDLSSLQQYGLWDDYERLKTSIQSLAARSGRTSEVFVGTNREGMVISLTGGLLFKSGKADLLPQSQPFLEEIGRQLTTKTNEVRVEGHTDNIPIDSLLYPTNWELSTARAVMVARHLVELDGLSPDRVSAGGYGEYRPVVPNDTRENRARNRRVDIVILYPQ